MLALRRKASPLRTDIATGLWRAGTLWRCAKVRYRALLRDEVGLTVEKPDEIDDELRYLCAALSATK